MPGGSEVLVTFVTTTSYGTWLPGDLRGYVQDGTILPGSPQLLNHARALMNHEPVYFTAAQRLALDHAINAAADEFGYVLTDLSVESWHLHWIVQHVDAVQTMVGRLKTRMRQKIGRGRIWTEGYCHRSLYTQQDVDAARHYIATHAGCRIIDGKRITPNT